MSNLSPLFAPDHSPEIIALMSSLIPLFIPIMVVLVLVTTILKGFSLWYAARGSQKWWFVALLVLNTVGILEIVYLIWFRPKASQEETPAVSSEIQA